ncbi:MAG: phosphodiester glycosidase family protein [Armatimonadetes bacterium]|nr:phosphodiester glycosidase family protein [Armatimonadota bacterium]
MRRAVSCSLALLAIIALYLASRALQAPSEATAGIPDPEAAPQVVPGPPVETVEYEGHRYTVCTVDLRKFDIELFWRDEKKRPFKGFAALETWLNRKGRRLLFAMNAGMYTEDFAPVGLYVENATELRPLNLANGSSNFCLKPNGVFAITEDGAKIVESSKYPSIKGKTRLATQSGPMLVIDGKLHPKFGRNSPSRLFRDGVGVISPDEVVFAITEDPVNFYEFATFFRDGLGCDNALFLDGSICSVYSTALNRCDSMAELGPILAVTGKL